MAFSLSEGLWGTRAGGEPVQVLLRGAGGSPCGRHSRHGPANGETTCPSSGPRETGLGRVSSRIHPSTTQGEAEGLGGRGGEGDQLVTRRRMHVIFIFAKPGRTTLLGTKIVAWTADEDAMVAGDRRAHRAHFNQLVSLTQALFKR